MQLNITVTQTGTQASPSTLLTGSIVLGEAVEEIKIERPNPGRSPHLGTAQVLNELSTRITGQAIQGKVEIAADIAKGIQDLHEQKASKAKLEAGATIDARILEVKSLRETLDLLEGRAKALNTPEGTLARRSIQQARHWLGEELHEISVAHPDKLPSNPFPNGNDTESTVIDPKSDKSL